MPKALITLIKIIAGILLVGLVVYALLSSRWAARPEDATAARPTSVPTATPEITSTPQPTAEPTPAATAEPTATPTPSPTPEPTPELFTISMVGDCTLASYPEARARDTSFENVVGTNWAYPFSNTLDIFSNDDMTIVNLECSLSDQTAYSGSTFSFLASTDAVNILTEGSVEFATDANNHAMDFGQSVLDDTNQTLTNAMIGHCSDGEGSLYVTKSGLIVGVYATYNGHYPDADTVAQGVKDLKDKGAEVVVVSAHWGEEASYYSNQNQTLVAHAAIDAGALVVFGHGPHRVQPYEEYNGGIIFYSVGNFVFGGNTQPADMDCIIAQAIICRDTDGTISLSGFKAIPASISSKTDINDYCPTVMEEGTEEYSRCLSKADGTFTGANNTIDYSFMHTDDSTEG